MNFNHLPLTTEDGTQLNLNALYKIAPSCFTEARDEKTGALRHVVDFKKLRQLLGDNAVEDEPEAYEFTWVGKNAARREAATPINKTLRPVPESSVDWEHTQNIYIEGDNLDALKLLQKSYLGGVKMIYIDPPYNTGNDFVYHDDFHRTQAEEDLEAGNVDELGNRFVKNTQTNGKFHSDWCSMIYPRLQLAHTLLSEDGLIFISIDEHESHNLRNISDEIFGEANYLTTITRSTGTPTGGGFDGLVNELDYILVYAKNINSASINGLPMSEEDASIYDQEDSRGKFLTRSLRRTGGEDRREDRPTMYYSIIAPDGTKVFPKGPTGYDSRWICSQPKYKELERNGLIAWKKNKKGEWQIMQKFYLGGRTKAPGNLWTDVEGNKKATREVRDLFDTNKFFDFPKPVGVLKKILTIGSNKDSIILDFFSGSGTTAHAVMQLNAEDGGHRKFILVQLPEETDENSEAYKAGYKNICEIGEERIRRAGKKIKEELQGAALVAVRNGESSQGDLFDQGNQQADGHKGRTLQADDLDTGFRVFRIDSSNMKDVYFAPKDLDPKELDLFADNVKEDRTELDLLYGCMVDWGVPLSLPLTKETIDAADGHTLAKDNGTIADGHKGRTLQADGNGVTVYTVNDGDLVACFGKPITDKVVKAMADKAPLRVLFRDSCFEKDEQKINIFEQFKQLLGWSDDEALNNIRVI